MFLNVHKPTRGRLLQNPHVLDLIFTNEEGMVSDLEIQSPIGKSDHSVLKFTFTCYLNKQNTKLTRYLYDRGNYDEMKKDLDKDWKEVFKNAQSVNDKWQVLKSEIISAVEKHVPKRQSGGSGKSGPNNKFNNRIIKAIRKKHRAWQRYLETKSGEKYQQYCRIRNKVKSLTRKAKKDLEQQIADQAKENPKNFGNIQNQRPKSKSAFQTWKSQIQGEKALILT